MKTCGRHRWGAGVLGFALLASGMTLAAEAAADPPPTGDRALRIMQRAKLEFPRKLLGAGITSGEVRLFLDVDAEGRLADHLVVAYTHYEFANVVSKTVGRWRFEPAIVDGRPIASTVAIGVRFEGSGVMIAERVEAEAPPASLSAFTFRARHISELDHVPKLIATVAPTNPAAADAPAITGRARVDFFIDEEGRVRMPVVVSTDDERLGWAALAAIARWQFEVPLRGGRAVLARASQIFTFAPEE